jgi:3-dehydroquinate dehydratase-1
MRPTAPCAPEPPLPFHPITLRGRALAQGRLPAICAPLVARNRAALVTEAAAVAAKQPDLLDGRVDFFDGLADTGEVVATAQALRNAARGIPILFTRRSSREGGERIALDEAQVLQVYEAVCASGAMDLADFEMGNDQADVARVREMTRRAGMPLVLSFHDFERTPGAAELLGKFAAAHRLGADVAKVAVMPRSMEDVHTLLGATLQASRALPIPVVSMAMGGLGAVSRACGGVFGSALTFAVGAQASAPGQMPIEDVRTAVAVLQRASAG